MKVLVSDNLAAEGVQMIRDAGFDVVEGWDIPKLDLPGVIADCDALVVRGATKATKELIDAAPQLKVIGRAGIGLDNVDLVHCKEKGIVVRNTPFATTASVAELTMVHMLAAHRDIVRGTVGTKAGKWEKKQLKGLELFGKTLGMIGIGRIGQAVATRAMAFGMKVQAFDAYAECADFSMCGLEEVLASSDVISIHCPLTPETKHMINAEAFSKMKDGVVILNISRGGIIEENDLYDAMVSGKVRAACLDTFEVEPPSADHKLFGLDNVFFTPHIGAQTKEGQLRAGTMVAEAVIEELNKLK